MFEFFNPNPKQNLIGDCVIRGICKLTGMDWVDAYMEVVAQGLAMYDMPSSNAVWGAYLYDNGFRRNVIPNTCPNCYTVKDFCNDYPQGKYLLATGTHVIAVEDGVYYDTWDSGNEIPIYYWRKEM